MRVRRFDPPCEQLRGDMLYGHFSEPDHVFRLCASWPIAVVWQRPPEGWRRREEAAADGVAGAADVGEEAN